MCMLLLDVHCLLPFPHTANVYWQELVCNICLKEVEEVTQYHFEEDVVLFMLIAATHSYLDMHWTKNS